MNLHSNLIEAINNVLLSNNLSLLQVHVKAKLYKEKWTLEEAYIKGYLK